MHAFFLCSYIWSIYITDLYDYDAFGILFGCLGGYLTDISLKRIGVDCIVPVHCTIWDTLQRIGIARKKRRGNRGGRCSDLVRPPLGNYVCRPDMFGVEKLNPVQPSGIQHNIMVKGGACVIPVR